MSLPPPRLLLLLLTLPEYPLLRLKAYNAEARKLQLQDFKLVWTCPVPVAQLPFIEARLLALMREGAHMVQHAYFGTDGARVSTTGGMVQAPGWVLITDPNPCSATRERDS